MKIDWEALKLEYMAAGNDVTLESLALKHEISVVQLSRRAEKEQWELLQAMYRRRLKVPQKTDILERTRADFDRQCRDALQRVAAVQKQERETKHSGK